MNQTSDSVTGVVLTTAQGHQLHIGISLDWELGIARYRVSEHDGTYSLGFDSGHYHQDCCQERPIELTYGVATESPFTHRHEDRPSIYRVILADRAVYHPSAMSDRHYWLTVRRDDGTASSWNPEAPDGTRKRAADTVRALTRDLLARPWYAELVKAHDRHHAPYRLARHREAIAQLEPEIADLARQWSAEHEALARQRAIIDSIPAREPGEQERSGPGHVLAA
jgi:hypothetical protein